MNSTPEGLGPFHRIRGRIQRSHLLAQLKLDSSVLPNPRHEGRIVMRTVHDG